MASNEDFPEEELEQTESAELQGPEGLLFVGDVIQRMSEEQLAALGEFANLMFGVEMQRVQNVDRELGSRLPMAGSEEAEPQPVLATLEAFREWAATHEYSDRRARNSWNTIGYTTFYREFVERDIFPRVKFLDEGSRDVIDLRSVHERLIASGMAESAWSRGTPAHVSFLAHLINDIVRPDDPLPASRSEWLTRLRSRD